MSFYAMVSALVAVQHGHDGVDGLETAVLGGVGGRGVARVECVREGLWAIDGACRMTVLLH